MFQSTFGFYPIAFFALHFPQYNAVGNYHRWDILVTAVNHDCYALLYSAYVSASASFTVFEAEAEADHQILADGSRRG